MKRKLITIFIGLAVVMAGLSGCYWNAGNVATSSPTMTPIMTPMLSPDMLSTINPATVETQLYVTPYPSVSPMATTVTTTKASIVTLTKAITNMNKVAKAVVVRNEDCALVGVTFDRNRYNGELTDALEEEISDAVKAKDASITSVTITDNITYYYDIEDLSKETNLTDYELQNKMDEIIDAIDG